MQDLSEPLVVGKADVRQARSKQAIARRSISSCGLFPLYMRTTEVSSPHSVENVIGPPSASAQ